MSTSKPNLNGLAPRRVRGRPFEKGNGGRRPGSKNRTTQVATALLDGEGLELVRTAVELAKAGDRQMLTFLLGRILPRERSVRFELPAVKRADDAVVALGLIADAVGTGEIVPKEGEALASIVKGCVEAINVQEHELRLEKIENELRILKNGNGS